MKPILAEELFGAMRLYYEFGVMNSDLKMVSIESPRLSQCISIDLS